MSDQGLQIVVNSRYLPEHSSPSQKRWFFAYRVRILNEGPLPAQVQRRHWIITDAHGETEEVEGAGLVGATELALAAEASKGVCNHQRPHYSIVYSPRRSNAERLGLCRPGRMMRPWHLGPAGRAVQSR